MKEIRDLAIAVLDDDNGIPSTAWELLEPLLRVNQDFDILQAVRATDNRWYLKEGWVEAQVQRA